MNIIKASAGSGKTYRLSHTYIDYLLKSGDPYAYRHILAVTFTNKATAEMKARILKDLDELSATSQDARDMLVRILHDYGAFSVSTIDSFFQQTLRSFARELGQYAPYQVELDTDSLVEEAMDRVLDSITVPGSPLARWLGGKAEDQMERVGKFKLESGLTELGKLLRRSDYRHLKALYGIDEEKDFSKERLKEAHRICREIIISYERQMDLFENERDKYGKFKYLQRTYKKHPEMAEYEEKHRRSYETALMLREQLLALGVAREFVHEYEALLQEKNVMPLDDSNALLKDIIDGSDAPFIYEKTGTRYHHFLLDEFQDTSRLQWENFLPLLKDADASGGNLIVGDVKQSIYRWRNSDWRLLGYEVEGEFPRALVENPEFNRRSAEEIVNFNSSFFEFAAEKLGLKDLYSGVHQTKLNDETQRGQVHVSFTGDQLQAVVDSVKEVEAAGARPSDIAVLVRNKADGAKVADRLISENYRVISDDSLNMKTAVTVRRLISLLTYYDDPSNVLGSYFAKSVGVVFPENYHSLVDFCEELIRGLKEYDPETFEAEVIFVCAFMDRLKEWTEQGGNNLRAFIKHWGEKKDDGFIGSPNNSDAIRILTIHKSKGLEFAHVIFPYANKVAVSDGNTIWCRLDATGTELGAALNGIYPVALSKHADLTYFDKAWAEEKQMEMVDNLNVFYVALTRATKSLHVIADSPTKKLNDALKANQEPEWMNLAELLYVKCGAKDEYRIGEPFDFNKLKRESEKTDGKLISGYPSIPLGDRLHASEDAADFFGEDGKTGADASVRLRGIMLHKILAGVGPDGELPSGLDPEDRVFLAERISNHPEWFELATRTKNEVTVFGADGSRNRPDRVVVGPDGGTVIIDYKFGAEHEGYIWQVRRYMKLYRQMGHPNVRGYVWYVSEDKVVEV